MASCSSRGEGNSSPISEAEVGRRQELVALLRPVPVAVGELGDFLFFAFPSVSDLSPEPRWRLVFEK
jgi:hypothetical protein